MLILMLCGCEKAQKDTQIVFTTEFSDDEVFRIDSASCTLPEVMIYMHTSQDQYISVFGSEIMEKDIGGATLLEQLKDTVISRLAQIKVMTLLADSYGIELSDSQRKKAEAAANNYIGSLTEKEKAALLADTELVAKMYEEYALANAVYEEITKDVNPEISDDEARTITVKHILIKNFVLNAQGEKVEYSPSENAAAARKAARLVQELNDGADFDAYAAKYNEDDKIQYSFGKGVMPESFENAAFELETDEISEVVETEFGYHIIKCVSTFDKAETDNNKQKIVKERKNEAFNQVYADFVKGLYSNMNTELWENLEFEADDNITTTNFFDIYNEAFEESDK